MGVFATTMNIPCHLIDADSELNVARQAFTPESCDSLAASIAIHGLQSPIMVRPVGDRYQIVFGFRRYTAVAINLGLPEIDCIVRDMSIEEARIANMVENLQRSDITFWEECCAVKDVFPQEMTLHEICRQLGKSDTWVRNRLGVWTLPKKIRDHVQAGILTAAHVGVILQQDPEERIRAASKIKAGIAAGESLRDMQREMTGRKNSRSKKQIQAVMTVCLEKGHEAAVHALRYAIGEISDTLLYELLDKQ